MAVGCSSRWTSKETALSLALTQGSARLRESPSVPHSSRGRIMNSVSPWVVRSMPTDDITTQELLKDHDVKLLEATLPLSN